MGYIQYYEFHDEDIKSKSINEQYQYWWDEAMKLYDSHPEPDETPEQTEYFNNRYMKAVSNYMELRPLVKADEDEKLILTDVMFLTVCPHEDVKLNKSLEVVKKFCEKSKIKNYLFVVEQRGTTDQTIHGIHYHILHTHEYDRASHYKREAKSTFNKISDVNNFHCLNFSGNKTSVDVKNRLQYILYEKKDKANNPKQLKQQIDVIFRKNNRLCAYYTNDFNFWKNNYLDI